MSTPSAGTLLVDLSPAPPPDDQELRAWASMQSVFVSSVMGGMSSERQAVVEAIRAVGARPIFFEDFGGMDDDPEGAYLGNVASSDIYIGILGVRYGAPLKTGYSATHAEYNEAIEQGLRISVWTAVVGLDGPQQDLLTAVRTFHTTGTYSSPADLAARVQARLHSIAAETIAPWVKVGNVIVRATHVEDRGTEILVAARVRNNTVASALEAMRPANAFGRNSDVRITWPNRTELVRVTNVVSTTTTSQTRTITVTASRQVDSSNAPSMRMAVNGHSPDDLTEMGLRSAFFGEPNTLGTMSLLAAATNPLPALNGVVLSEDAYEQIARLLITEELVGHLHADHVTQFRLSPPRGGARRMRLGWMPPKPYVNVEPVERVVEGVVPIDNLTS
jgi:hypothetical protein